MNKLMNSKCSVKVLLIIAMSFNILIVATHFFGFSKYQRSPAVESIGKKKSAINSTRMFDVPNFEYLISKPKCGQDGSSPYFVTLIHSSPTQFTRRAGVRDSFMSDHDPRTKIYFLMGMVPSKALQKRIEEEESQYEDIIQGNFVDSYHNLTYKHTMALKWFTENCPDVKYLLKMDDDVFVNVPAVYEHLVNNKKDKKFILGINFAPWPASREGKRKVSRNDIRENYTPEHAGGGSIIYSNDFVKKAYNRTFTTKFLWIDDLYISGYIRMQMNVRIESMWHLRLTDDQLNMVLNGTITALPDPMFLVSQHDQSYDDMIKLWNFTAAYRRQHQHRLVECSSLFDA